MIGIRPLRVSVAERMSFDSLVCRESAHKLAQAGDADVSASSGIAEVYRDLVADTPARPGHRRRRWSPARLWL
jgi:hypothetical protein